jgi:hypothetical protein
MRPLTTVEILDAALLSLRRNWVQFYATSGLGTAPLAVLVMGYFLWLGTLVEGTDDAVFYTGTGIWALCMTLAWSFNSIARGAVLAAAVADARGDPLTMGQAWRAAAKHGAGNVFVGLTGFSAAFAAGTCLAAPGVFLALTWWVARPSLMVEGRPFAAALRRSWRLTEGYRGKAFGLWLLLLLLWVLGTLSLHLSVEFAVGTAAGLLGIDTSGVTQHLRFANQAYTVFLLAVLFVLMDPVKTAMDAMFYLDLRIRREGADLQERLRRLQTQAAAAAAVLVALLACGPAGAVTTQDYAAKVRALRSRVQAAEGPGQVDPALLGDLRHQLVEMPGGQKLTVRNPWLDEGLESWESGKGKTALLSRLEALERSLAGVSDGGQPATPLPPPEGVEGDPGPALRQLLQEPEFQRLAERSELRELAKRFDLSQPRTWWESFVDWIRKTLFRPAQPRVSAPTWSWPDATPVVWVILAVVVLFLLALLVKFIIERPAPEDAREAAVGAAPPLEASATENALDHSVDEWELFARQWLSRGDVRQAIRALYLATLVHLHRERRIDYNRAFTNWVYVRQFRGEAEQKGTLRRLTSAFDEVWYGERPCGEEQYRAFEKGVRDLGTPAPV